MLLDSLEAALPLVRTSDLSNQPMARRIYSLSEGLIGEIVGIVTKAAVAAIRSGAERRSSGRQSASANDIVTWPLIDGPLSLRHSSTSCCRAGYIGLPLPMVLRLERLPVCSAWRQVCGPLRLI
ncbi:hypothetical protein FHX08_005278 [Rhizobium sp. BK529]|nr:hypothetical protein [Rhizobium sp. BK529]